MKKRQQPSEFAMMITESFNSGIRKARAKHFAMGLPVVYMKNGTIHYEYPPANAPGRDGELRLSQEIDLHA